MTKYYQLNPQIREKAGALLDDIYAEFGWKTRLIAPLIGRYVFKRLKREEELLAAGQNYEPRSFCEYNAAALALKKRHFAEHSHVIPQLLPLPQPA